MQLIDSIVFYPILFSNLKLFIYFILEYSWLAMLWYFQVNIEETQTYMYMYPFSPKLPSYPG